MQSKVQAPEKVVPRASRHFAFSVLEKFEIRDEILSLEESGFFENRHPLVLSFFEPQEPTVATEKLIFTFLPPKDIPPSARDERKSASLARRLSIAVRVAYGVSRLTETAEMKSYRLDREEDLGVLREGLVRTEIASISSQIGVLKVFVDSVRPNSQKKAPPLSQSMAITLKIQENYIQSKETPIILNLKAMESFSRGDSFGSNSPVSPYYSEISSTHSFSPISASREFLAWPSMSTRRRRSFATLPAAESDYSNRLSSEDETALGSTPLVKLVTFCQDVTRLPSFERKMDYTQQINFLLQFDKQQK